MSTTNPRNIKGWPIYIPAHGISEAALETAGGVLLAGYDGNDVWQLASADIQPSMAIAAVVSDGVMLVQPFPGVVDITTPLATGLLYLDAASDGYMSDQPSGAPVARHIGAGVVMLSLGTLGAPPDFFQSATTNTGTDPLFIPLPEGYGLQELQITLRDRRTEALYTARSTAESFLNNELSAGKPGWQLANQTVDAFQRNTLNKVFGDLSAYEYIIDSAPVIGGMLLRVQDVHETLTNTWGAYEDLRVKYKRGR